MTSLSVAGNPALKEYEVAVADVPPDIWRVADCLGGAEFIRETRIQHGAMFAWAVPSDKIVDEIATFTKAIVEIGAGTGYWAGMLSSAGVGIVAYDIAESNPDVMQTYTDRKYFAVEDGGPEMAAQHSERTLFLCWPPGTQTPVSQNMAFDSLTQYVGAGGESLVYIGEWRRHRNGTAAFFDLVDREFDLIGEPVTIRNWPGETGALRLYRKKAVTNNGHQDNSARTLSATPIS